MQSTATPLKEVGYPPAAIKLLLKGEQGIPFTVVPGITFVINPDLLGKVADVAQVVRSAAALLTDLLR